MKWVYPVWLARGASKGSNLVCHKLNQLREYVLGQTLARKKFSAFFPVYTVWSATPTIYALSLASIHPQIAFPLIPSPLWLHRFIFSLALLWWSHSPAELDLTAPKFLLFLWHLSFLSSRVLISICTWIICWWTLQSASSKPPQPYRQKAV